MKFPRSTLMLFAMSASMVDVFAIPLLIIARRNQNQFDQLPEVRRRSTSRQQDQSMPPLEVHVDSQGFLHIDGSNVSLVDIRRQLTELQADRNIHLVAQCDEKGSGNLAAILHLTLMCQELELSDRFFLVSREPEAAKN